MSLGKFMMSFLLLAAASVAAAPNPLLERLRIDHAALVSAENDFHARRDRGVLQGNELTDYAAYVARLYRQVAEDCAALASNKISVPAELACPDSPAVLIAPAAVDQEDERTGAENTADLDAELFSGISEFDEMLLREQQRIRAATPHAGDGDGYGGGGSGDGDGEGTSGEDGEAMAGGEGEGQLTDNRGDSSDNEGSTGTGSTQPAGKKSEAPPGTPNGSDDDVVARQLREAAEKETDPVLKKKLWEEYRKYKEGTW